MLDIKSEGFVFKYKEKGNPNKVYTKPYKNNPRGLFNQYIDLIYNDKNNWVLICQGDKETPFCDWDIMFTGQINNQKDLTKILKMVIV